MTAAAQIVEALVHPPALLSISGGRTSGLMLRMVLDAYGGKLPCDIVPVFCNTGLEHEATYQFLRELGARWTPIVWLEYRYTKDGSGGQHGFAVVDYCSASREGEPFDQAIEARKFLPNPVTRFCTGELKVQTGNRYAKSLGWDEWDRAVGLRADEPRRVAKLRGESGENVCCPLHRAGITLADVRAFWKAQPFDLHLPGDDNAFGNCVGCFLKSRAKLAKVFQTDPASGEWWARHEEQSGSTFRIDRPTYRQQLTTLTVQGRMFDDTIEDDTLPCMCHE